tara:strand:- start:2797 stop:3168 length:372 start_codon:yes stop_codon:yes gene_type:complete
LKFLTQRKGEEKPLHAPRIKENPVPLVETACAAHLIGVLLDVLLDLVHGLDAKYAFVLRRMAPLQLLCGPLRAKGKHLRDDGSAVFSGFGHRMLKKRLSVQLQIARYRQHVDWGSYLHLWQVE